MTASSQVLTSFVFIAIALSAPIQAAVHIVGDDSGWIPGFDYVAWAKGKEFRVGDQLVFNYPEGNHNVFRASGPEFQTCSVPLTAPLTSGNDIITLTTQGRKWYLCGKANGGHCMLGQKLVIDVLPASWSPTPAPAPQVSAWAAPVWSLSPAVAPAMSPAGSARAASMWSPSSGAPAMAPSDSGWDPNAPAPSAAGMAPSPVSWSRKLLAAEE